MDPQGSDYSTSSSDSETGDEKNGDIAGGAAATSREDSKRKRELVSQSRTPGPGIQEGEEESTDDSDSDDGGDEGNASKMLKRTRTETGTSSGTDSAASAPIAGGGEELHPLLNPIVLAHLFKVLPTELLAPSRLVCKAWLESSLPAWRNSIVVTTFQYPKDKSSSAQLRSWGGDDWHNSEARCSRNLEKLKGFMDFWSKERGLRPHIPFPQIRLKDWQFWARYGEDIGGVTQWEMHRFWNMVTENVTKLELIRALFKTESAFQQIIYQSCPKLQSLAIRDCEITGSHPPYEVFDFRRPFYGEHAQLKSLYADASTRASIIVNTNHSNPITWLELLSHFPSLTRLALRRHRTDADAIESMLEAVKLIRSHNPGKLPIELLSIETEGGLSISGYASGGSRKLCDLLQELRIGLDSISVDLNCDLDLLQEQIQFHAKTLEKLEVLRDCSTDFVSPSFPCNFPFAMELNSLTQLKMRAAFCSSMEFIKFTPNLKKLYLMEREKSKFGGIRAGSWTTDIVRNTPEEGMGGVTLPALRELWIANILSGDDDDLRKLCGWLPNVEVLTMSLDNRKFAVICEHWRGLKHVHQLGTNLEDEGITGGGGGGIRPNIKWLSDLECFQHVEINCKLTDASVHDGFLELPKLKNLGITSFDDLIGKEARKALYEKIPGCQVKSIARSGIQSSSPLSHANNGGWCEYLN